MSAFQSWFDRIYVINLASRPDRWNHFTAEMDKIGVSDFIRFEAHNRPIGDDRGSGNFGCCASHRGVLEIIAHEGCKRALVFEDDARVIDPKNFASLWAHMEGKIPADWDMLYLGGHYGENPQGRVNPNMLRTGTMLTTSTYAITAKQARKMAPHIYGVGPIDSIYGPFNRADKCYCLQPRLFDQYPNYSDLQDREMDNSLSMRDRFHESLMPYSYVGDFKDYVRPEPRVSAGRVQNPDQHKQ